MWFLYVFLYIILAILYNQFYKVTLKMIKEGTTKVRKA